MPIARANPQFNVIKEFGSDGELAFIEVDYINDVSAETGDFDAGDSAGATPGASSSRTLSHLTSQNQLCRQPFRPRYHCFVSVCKRAATLSA